MLVVENCVGLVFFETAVVAEPMRGEPGDPPGCVVRLVCALHGCVRLVDAANGSMSRFCYLEFDWM